uniref:Uncharacterized protein n=1 Tax=Clytia hemisphaerica TaxID=252671 RepID=A0A7M5V6M8_9CNID
MTILALSSNTLKTMAGPTAVYALRLLTKCILFILRDALTTLYVLVTNATFQNLVLYTARGIIKGFLSLTYYLIGVTSAERNPIVQVVEKEIKDVPTSPIMASKEPHKSTRSVLKQSTDEVKLVSMSFATVLLTWVIKAATTSRRALVGSISEHKRNREKSQ